MTAAPSLIATASRHSAEPEIRIGSARAGRLIPDQVTLFDTACTPRGGRRVRSRRSSGVLGSRWVSALDEPRGSRRALHSL